MNKKILNEMSEMKYLFGYKRGVVISEQENNHIEDMNEDMSESESSVEMESALNSFESLEEGEKMKWKTAIRQCIEELGLSHKIKEDSRPFLYLAAFAAGGIILNIPFLIGMGVLPAIFIGLVDKPMIKKIIQCAREKRKASMSKMETPTEEQPQEIPQEKMQESRKKVVRLTETQLMELIDKAVKEQEEEFDDTPIEDVSPSLDDEEDDIEDYGFDYEDEDEGELGIDDEFQNKMRFKDVMKHHKLGSVGIGSGTRWDKESEKEWSPIKADDLPLDKFLKSKYNKK